METGQLCVGLQFFLLDCESGNHISGPSLSFFLSFFNLLEYDSEKIPFFLLFGKLGGINAEKLFFFPNEQEI